MSNTATYLCEPVKTVRHTAKPLTAAFSLLLAIFFIVAGVFTSLGENNRQAHAFDVDRWAACLFGDDSIPGFMYNATQTDQINFELRSKSAMTSGISDVSGALNGVLEMFGNDFQTVNETVLGTSLDPLNPNEDLEEEDSEELFNSGARVNPFDRFGVAGLNFTSYSGEWRYVIIDACAAGGEPQDPKAGVFYEDRLEPQSTWDDITNSADVRTQQFDKGFFSQFGSSFLNVIANWIFVLTKFVVVMTISFISFAFTDIVSLMGLDTFFAGDNTNDGLFGMLYQGMFLPLVVLAFAFTGVYILYQALSKRQYRKSMGALIRSIVLFLIAILISSAPAFWTSLPNNIATVLQSVVVTSLNSGLSGGSGLCETDVANAKIVTDESDDAAGILEQASRNMSSSINCQFWQTFLLTPWAQGQWGTGWENTWAADAEPDLGNMSDYDTIDNTNQDMVGDAAVPLGDDEFVNNWAIFNISTNTNAHAPLGHPGERSKITNGVSNDWYRIVDALSNYQEETVSALHNQEVDEGIELANSDIDYDQPADVPVTTEWNTWTGNEASGRIWTAFSSVFIAGIGLAAPLFFAFLSAVFSIGVSLLSALAPLFLLFGIWADRGWNIFLGWLQLLINTTIARVVLGGLMALSVALTMAAIQLMDDIGWWQGMLMLIVISVVLFQSRRKIMNAVKVARMSAVDLSQTSSQLMQKTTGVVKGIGRAGVSTVGGGVAANRAGGEFGKGARKALSTEFKNQIYRHPTALRAMGQYEEARMAHRGDDDRNFIGHQVCNGCGATIASTPDRNGTEIFHGGRDDNGNIYCAQCFNDGIRDDMREITIEIPKESLNDSNGRFDLAKETQESEVQKMLNERFSKNDSTFQKNSSQNQIERIRKGVDKDGNSISNKMNSDQLKGLLKHTEYDIKKHKNNIAYGRDVYPQPPDELALYLDADSVAAAWRKSDYDWIRMAYTAAWTNWYQDTTGEVVEHKLDDLLEYLERQSPEYKKRAEEKYREEEEFDSDPDESDEKYRDEEDRT